MNTSGSGGVVLKRGNLTYEEAFNDFLINSSWSILSNSTISGMILKCVANHNYDSPFISARLNDFGNPIQTILVKVMIMTNSNKTDTLDLTYTITKRNAFKGGEGIPFRSSSAHPYSIETQPKSFIINEAHVQNYVACKSSLDDQTLLNGISPRVFGMAKLDSEAIFENKNFYYKSEDNINNNYADDFLNRYNGDLDLVNIQSVDNQIKNNIKQDILHYVEDKDKVEFAKFLHFVGYGNSKSYQEKSNIQYSLCFLGMEMLQNAIIEYQFRQEIQNMPKEEDEYYKLMQYLVWCCVKLYEEGYVHRDLHQGNVMYVSHILNGDKKNDLFVIDYGRVKNRQTINENTQFLGEDLRSILLHIIPMYATSKSRALDFIYYINNMPNHLTLSKFKEKAMPPGKNMRLAYLQQPNLGLSQIFLAKKNDLIQLMEQSQSQNNNQIGGRAHVMSGQNNNLSASNQTPFKNPLDTQKIKTKPQEKIKIFELEEEPFYLDKYLDTKESIDKLFNELTTQFANQPFLLPGYEIPKLKIPTAIKGGKRKKRSKKSKKKHSRKTKNKKRKTHKRKRK